MPKGEITGIVVIDGKGTKEEQQEVWSSYVCEEVQLSMLLDKE